MSSYIGHPTPVAAAVAAAPPLLLSCRVDSHAVLSAPGPLTQSSKMRASTAQLALAGLLALSGSGNAAPAKQYGAKVHPVKSVQLGPRPYWLVDNMEESPLKSKLDSCKELQMKPTKLSIGHRGGGTLQMPEETRESILAGEWGPTRRPAHAVSFRCGSA